MTDDERTSEREFARHLFGRTDPDPDPGPPPDEDETDERRALRDLARSLFGDVRATTPTNPTTANPTPKGQEE